VGNALKVILMMAYLLVAPLKAKAYDEINPVFQKCGISSFPGNLALTEKDINFEFDFKCSEILSLSGYDQLPGLISDYKAFYDNIDFPRDFKVEILDYNSDSANVYYNNTARIAFKKFNQKVLMHEVGHVLLGFYMNKNSKLWRFENYKNLTFQVPFDEKKSFMKIPEEFPILETCRGKVCVDSAPYHEIFADLSVALYFNDPDLTQNELLERIKQDDPQKEHSQREAALRSFSFTYDAKNWASMDPHSILSPCRDFLWKLATQDYHDRKKEFLLVVLRAIKIEYEARVINKDLHHISNELMNRRFIEAIKRESHSFLSI
jgi:hypothetical protein